MTTIEGDNDHPQPATVTLHDVALAAGVSQATVSRSFSRPSKVNPQTLQTVLAAAQKLGYHSNLIHPNCDDTQSLHGLLAIVVTDIGNPISVRFARGAQQYCKTKQYGLLISDTEEDVENERLNIQRSIDHVDGLILDSTRLPESQIRRLAGMKPTVILNRIVQGVTSITADCMPCLADVVMRLHQLGHQEISYVSGPNNSWQNARRKEAIRQQCEALGIRLHVLPCAYPIESNLEQSFFTFMRRPTSAVIAFDDAIAIEFMHRLIARGITIPNQISIVGVNDIALCKAIIPSLTSVAQPYEYMGRTAAQMIINQLLHLGNGTDGATHSCESTLHVRDSIGLVNPLMAHH